MRQQRRPGRTVAAALRGACAVLVACGGWAGCVTAPPAAAGPAASGEDAGPAAEAPRAAQGSLRQEEITVELRVGAVQVRLTPLDPEILRLTAPDTRRRLQSLAGGSGEGVAFLVAVFTEEPGGADFEPRSVSLENRGRTFRPSGIRRLTTGWGTRLHQRQAEQAVYTFPGEVDLELPLTVEVAGVRSGAWAEILPRIDAERARVRARGGTEAPQASSSNFRILR